MLITISTNDMKMASKNFNLMKKMACNTMNIKIIGNIVLNDGSQGLPEIYNASVKSFPEETEYIFMHHDVVMKNWNWYDKLQDLRKQGCDIIGLAGTTNFDRRTGYWWIQQGKNQFSDCHGAVKHTKDGKEWLTTFGPAPKLGIEVIDGLFMYVRRTVFDSGVLFDEKFKFHMYDCSFCLRARKFGFKIGVSDILVKHLSIGEMDQSYEESRKLFMELYGEK